MQPLYELNQIPIRNGQRDILQHNRYTHLVKTDAEFDEYTPIFNPFQPSDAMWRHTFHLSLICMSFAH
jgi:hypothetical protein